ncbi:MAG: hypothetical protein WKG32_09565 [Gemmatimonadaceae bacterium]
MPWLYRIYGLGLEINEPVSGLLPAATGQSPDVRVHLARRCDVSGESAQGERPWFLSSDRETNGLPSLILTRTRDGGFRFRYADGTEFLVSGRGDRVRAAWPASSTLADTITYLLNPVLGFILRLRGKTCLHASAFEVEGQAVAVSGPAGAGKSTTAAAFARAGYRVLTDDVLALDYDGRRFRVPPGYAQLKLWSTSAEMLFGAPDALPRLTPTWAKQYLDLRTDGYEFSHESLPLGAVYVLDERVDDQTAPRIETLDPAAAVIALVGNSYPGALLDVGMRASELCVLSRLAASVPVRRVTPHAAPERLPALRDAIRDDFVAVRAAAVLSAS